MLWYEVSGGTESQRWATIRSFKNSPGIVVSQFSNGRVRVGISSKHVTHLLDGKNPSFGTELIPFLDRIEGETNRHRIDADRFRCNVCGDIKHGIYEMADHHTEMHLASTMTTFMGKKEKKEEMVTTVERRQYTPGEISQMTELYRSGKTAAQIANEMGRTQQAIVSALSHHRITKFRPSISTWASKSASRQFLNVKHRASTAVRGQVETQVLGVPAQKVQPTSLATLLERQENLALELAAVSEQIRARVAPLLAALEQVR